MKIRRSRWPAVDPWRWKIQNPSWRWWVCGLLLLATMLNYMDRQTLVMASTELVGTGPAPGGDVRLTVQEYGAIERGFSMAFACGGLVLGMAADRTSLYWFYPLVVLAWSAAGLGTGLVHGFASMFLCRSLLGLSEAGHWPCALRTTQWLLPDRDRNLGNALLQSGASIGAIVTPLIYQGMVAPQVPGSWRRPFGAIGALGIAWCLAWLVMLRRRDLPQPGGRVPEPAGGESFWAVLADRRFVVLVVVVIVINGCWHLFRVWTILFLTRSRGYSDRFAQYFTSAYYLVTDLGALAAGGLASALAHRGWSGPAVRKAVFLGCALLTALAGAGAALAPHGPLLISLLLLVGFATLGMFPIYYSLAQELTVRNQGKLTGVLGFFAWTGVAVMQGSVGNSIARTGSYTLAIALGGLAPLLGGAALLAGWPRAPSPDPR